MCDFDKIAYFLTINVRTSNIQVYMYAILAKHFSVCHHSTILKYYMLPYSLLISPPLLLLLRYYHKAFCD